MSEFPPLETDRLIHGARITWIKDEDRSPLSIALRHSGPTVDYCTEVEFRGVRYFQFSSDSALYLDSVEVFQSIEAASDVPAIKALLPRSDRAALHLDAALGSYFNWLKDQDVKVYRLLQLTGGESFVICQGVSRETWSLVDGYDADRDLPRPQHWFDAGRDDANAVNEFFAEFARGERLTYVGAKHDRASDPLGTQLIFTATIGLGNTALFNVVGNVPGRERQYAVLIEQPTASPGLVAKLRNRLEKRWPTGSVGRDC